MGFNSLTFIVFFVIVVFLYRALAAWSHKKMLLLAASYFFYAWWDWRYLGLIVFSTMVDYWCGMLMAEAKQGRRRALLAVSLCVNLGVLGIFKYFNFFMESAVDLLIALGMHPDPPFLQVALPVGISFYTFQSMSYTIDIYRKRLEPTQSPLDFSLYVAFFPQLVAGPIVRAVDFLPQLASPRRITREDVLAAMQLIVLGYFFKVGVADNLASSVDYVYSGSTAVMPLEAWLGSHYFAFQIFADFCGYTFFARGVALMLGFRLPENFNAPYLATTCGDFWRRWHISLSTWLRDYLYISMGGNRGGRMATFRNLMITMLLGGLWHGANWTFVAWGALHGAYLVAERALAARFAMYRREPRVWGDLARIFIVYHLVVIGWVFFRAQDVDQAFALLAMMGDMGNLLSFQMPQKALLKDGVWLAPMGAYFAWHFLKERGVRISTPAPARMAGLAGLLFITIVCREATDAFIYFQF